MKRGKYKIGRKISLACFIILIPALSWASQIVIKVVPDYNPTNYYKVVEVSSGNVVYEVGPGQISPSHLSDTISLTDGVQYRFEAWDQDGYQWYSGQYSLSYADGRYISFPVSNIDNGSYDPSLPESTFTFTPSASYGEDITNAIPIDFGFYQRVSTEGYTNDGVTTSALGYSGKDVVFKYTAQFTDSVNIAINSIDSTGTGLAVYENSGSNYVTSVYSGNFSVAAQNINFKVTQGNTYYFVLVANDTYSPFTAATISFSYGSSLPINDACASAANLTVDNPNLLQSRFYNATGTGFTDCKGNLTSGKDIYFSFTAQDSIQLLKIVPLESTGSLNYFYAEVESTCSGPIVQSCLTAPGTQLDTTTLSMHNLTAGSTYKVRLTYYGSYFGDQRVMAGVYNPQLNSNDDCSSATLLTVRNTFDDQYQEASLIGSTHSGVSAPCGNSASYTATTPDTWFKAVVPASGRIRFMTTVQKDNALDLRLAIYDGSCGSLNPLSCSLTSPVAADTLSGLTPGDTLFVMVWDDQGITQGVFDIMAQDVSPIPQPYSVSAASQNLNSIVINIAGDYSGVEKYIVDVSADTFNTFVSGYLNQEVYANSGNVKDTISGLSPGTFYQVRVRSFSNGLGYSTYNDTLYTNTSPSAMTSIIDGPWNQASTWSTGAIPTANDAVTIHNKVSVAPGSNISVFDLTINNDLAYGGQSSLLQMTGGQLDVKRNFAIQSVNNVMAAYDTVGFEMNSSSAATIKVGQDLNVLVSDPNREEMTYFQLGGTSSSTLSVGGGVTLSTSGNPKNGGLFNHKEFSVDNAVVNIGSDLTLDSSDPDTIPTMEMYFHNVNLNIGGNLSVTGSLGSKKKQLMFDATSVHLKNDFNRSYYGDDGYVKFNNSTLFLEGNSNEYTQYLPGFIAGQDSIIYDNVVLNSSYSDPTNPEYSVEQDSGFPVFFVKGSLSFNQGVIEASGDNSYGAYIAYGPQANIATAPTAQSYSHGNVAKYGNAGFTFTVGDPAQYPQLKTSSLTGFADTSFVMVSLADVFSNGLPMGRSLAQSAVQQPGGSSPSTIPSSITRVDTLRRVSVTLNKVGSVSLTPSLLWNNSNKLGITQASSLQLVELLGGTDLGNSNFTTNSVEASSAITATSDKGYLLALGTNSTTENPLIYKGKILSVDKVYAAENDVLHVTISGFPPKISDKVFIGNTPVTVQGVGANSYDILLNSQGTSGKVHIVNTGKWISSSQDVFVRGTNPIAKEAMKYAFDQDVSQTVPSQISSTNFLIHTKVGDLNQDGKPDIVSSALSSDTITFYLSGPSGYQYSYFSPSLQYGAFIGGFDIVDFNTDGKLDVVYSYYSSSESVEAAVLSYNSGSQQMEQVDKVNASGTDFPTGLTAMDEDNDGFPDLIYDAPADGEVRHYKTFDQWFSSGNMPLPTAFSSSPSTGFVVGDLANTGNLYYAAILSNTGQVEFVSPYLDQFFSNAANADNLFNLRKVKLDSATTAVSVLNYTKNQVEVFIPSDSTHTITEIDLSNPSDSIQHYTFGDMNRDGYQDAVVFYRRGFEIFLNDKSQNLVTTGDFYQYDKQGNQEYILGGVAADVTTDGYNDLLLLKPNQTRIFQFMPQDIGKDSTALVALYNNTLGSNWNNNTNWLSGDLNTWYGVTVEGNRVTKLNLSGNNLDGTLPGALDSLAYIRQIDLSQNNLRGAITGYMGWHNLDSVDFSGNEFDTLINVNSPQASLIDFSNNRLDFEDLKPLYGGIVGQLTLFPQKLYLPADTVVNQGESIMPSVDIQGTGNHFQWYKGSTALSGDTLNTLVLNNIQATNEGMYHCTVTNSDTLFTGKSIMSDTLRLRQSSLAVDRESLRDLYEMAGGDQWTTVVWDTTQTDLRNWDTNDDQDIVIQNSHVVAVNLPGNNLNGIVPKSIKNIRNLRRIDISDNNIYGLPKMAAYPALDTVWASGDQLGYDDIVPNLTISNFDYSNQQMLGSGDQLIKLDSGATYTLSTITPGTNEYQWYRNGQPVGGATNFSYTINGLNYDNMGKYYVRVTNSAVQAVNPNFYLQSYTTNLLATADLDGFVETTLGNRVTAGKIYLFDANSTGAYDTIPFSNGDKFLSLDGNGVYSTTKLVLGDYLLLAKPNASKFPDILPTYWKNTIDWGTATTLNFRGHRSNVKITPEQSPAATTGQANVGGTVEIDLSDQARFSYRPVGRARGAGVSIRRRGVSVRGNFADVLVAFDTTDVNGNFTFPTLPAGDYAIHIDYPGVPVDTTSFIYFSLNGESGEDLQLSGKITDSVITVNKVSYLAVDHQVVRSLHFYPNPTKDYIFIDQQHFEPVKVEIFDLSGHRQVYKLINNNKERIKVEVSSLKAGVYLIRVESSAGSYFTSKLIKK